jgi:hypothetical protein
MKFFAKQKVDQVGITAVTLQKILLFLMILSLFTLFNGGLFSFILCLIGFIGAYKRRTGMLTAYVSISVVFIVLCSVIAISSIFVVSTDDYVYEYSPSASSSSQAVEFAQTNMHRLQRAFARKLSAIGSESASSSVAASSDSAAPGVSWGNDSYSYSEEDDAAFGLIFLLIVVMIFAFFLAYLKVYSVVLAWRLRKMIIATATALPTTDTAPQTHEFAPTNTSCAMPEQTPAAPVSPYQPAPMFAPGFAPYPYAMPMMVPPHMQGQFQGQFPHHAMFGQQPVFYTYAPMPQPPEEKL